MSYGETEYESWAKSASNPRNSKEVAAASAPWEYVTYSTGTEITSSVIASTPDNAGVIIATVHPVWLEGQQDANGHLLAAAKDMLAALQMVKGMFEGLRHDVIAFSREDELRVNMAINKALGKFSSLK